MAKRNTEGLDRYAKSKNSETIEKVSTAIDRLKRSQPNGINFSTVAKEAGVSKATLYNNDVLRERILGLRATTKGVSTAESPAEPKTRSANKGNFDEIRKLRDDKKKLIVQLVELEALREENAKLRLELNKRGRKDEYLL